MSNGLVDLMHLCAEQNAKNDNSIKCVAGKVVTVTDDMFRADIELGQGQVVKDMMNKSGEKLKVGDTVWIEYFTYPSSGWIARRNGEPDPLGGGASFFVENAAVDTTDRTDFIIERELMMDVKPSTKLYYGNIPDFCVCQGHYMLLANVSSVHTPKLVDGKWIIGDREDLYDKIIANRHMFGNYISDIHGFYNGGNAKKSASPDGEFYYPSSYGYISSAIGQVQIKKVDEQPRYQVQLEFIYHYFNTIDPMGDWEKLEDIEIDLSSEKTYPNRFYAMDFQGNTITEKPITDFFIVPVSSGIDFQASHHWKYGAVGYQIGFGFLVFMAQEGQSDYSVKYFSPNGILSTPWFASEAEMVFALGISKHTEYEEEG